MAETEVEKAKQMVVLLIGPPGSGKSTFCHNVMRSSRRPWSHVCQATVNNGKAGTTAQCLNMARNSLTEGKSVFIDRYNIEKKQRSEFIKLGSPEVKVQAVVLELPAHICINRSGDLQRGRAKLTVNSMIRNKELPKVEEGFSRIMFCYNDTDVQNAVNIYSMLGPKDILPSGCFGQNSSESSSSNEANTIGVPPSADTVPTLAFPSISTEDYQFNLEKASDIIVEKVEEFLPKLGTARLILVGLSHESEILSLVKTKASQMKIDSTRFFTYVGDITKLHSEGDLYCNVIANPANCELKPGGEGVNGVIFNAAWPHLEAATRACANIILPGKALVIHLPSTCPFTSDEGITHVIHVLGPNMDPSRSNYLNNDYDKGCNILREAYTSLFEGFLSILQDQSKVPKRSNQKSGSDSGENIMEDKERIKRLKGEQG